MIPLVLNSVIISRPRLLPGWSHADKDKIATNFTVLDANLTQSNPSKSSGLSS